MMAVHTGNRARIRGMTVEYWDAAKVQSRLVEMGIALKRLRARGLKPAGYQSTWPNFVREYWDEFSAAVARGGEWEETRVVLAQPNPQQITRMDECLGWFRLLENDDDRRLLWVWAMSVNQRLLARIRGISRETLRRRTKRALNELVQALNHRIEGR